MEQSENGIPGKEATAPPYVSYATFVTLLDWLKEMPVIPSQLDRSLWKDKFGGSTGTQLMAGLKFLKLLDSNKPQPRLDELAHADREGRARLMQQVLRDTYGVEIVDQLANKTPKLLDERLEALGATDATHRKALSFFVNAAKANGLAVPLIIGKKSRMRAGKPKSRRSRGRTPNGGNPPPNGGQIDKDNGPQFKLHMALSAMLNDLQEQGPKWTKTDRDRWFHTFEATLDYAYPPKKDDSEALGIQ